MWPWEHLAIGYVCLSVWRRVRSGRPPDRWETLAVVVGTQLPDLVDKPLGWGTVILPAGRSLAHSLPAAGFAVAVAVLLGDRVGRRDVAVAFAVGYLSHLPGDVVFPLAYGSSLDWRFLLWPFVSVPTANYGGVTGRVLELLGQFGAFLLTPRGLAYAALEGLLLLIALLAWWRDGWPGVPRRENADASG